jgi:hypothetical protein
VKLLIAEKFVGLVEDDGLYSAELEVGFDEELHESSGSGDDDVGVD